jgi:hypothetical protein
MAVARLMTGKPLTEPFRMLVALQAAAYIRWVETRKGAPPTADDTQRFIQGLLDADDFSYELEDPQMIELLALAVKLDEVDAFISKTGYFEKLDRAVKGISS